MKRMVEVEEKKRAKTGGKLWGFVRRIGYLNSVFSFSCSIRNSNSGTSTSGDLVDDALVSGGGFSQNGKFSYGYASSPGRRSSMEDCYETRIDGVKGEIVGFFGVFDGHGGAQAAEYIKRNLFRNIVSHPKFTSHINSAIAEAYKKTDSDLMTFQKWDAGSTATTAIIVGDRLVVANVGDSRAVICRGGNAVAVSSDHKPNRSDERKRIEDAGGQIMWAGTWRVGGILAVSRAFGNRLLKEYVVADPEINEEVIDKSLEFLILASDGLWDVVSNEEAVSMIEEIDEPSRAAKRLLHEASERGSADNITCVVGRNDHSLFPFHKIVLDRYCQMAKAVFKELDKVPYVIELDERENGFNIQKSLSGFVGRRTVPQVFVKGKHIGGSDDTIEAYENGNLAKLLGANSRDV